MRVTCVTKRWEHHTASGGYDRLAREVNGTAVARQVKGGFLHRVMRTGWRGMARSRPYLLDYTYGDWLAERQVLWQSWWHRPEVVHVLYGDEQLDLLLRHRRWLRCPLMATFHLPPARVQERFEKVQKHLLGGLDAAVVVAQSQLAQFRQWLDNDRVVFIPHGIDTERFSPGNGEVRAGTLRVISVGDHMRDWTALHGIIDECAARKLPVEFDIVAQRHYWPFLTGCAKVRLHAGIAEERLVELYQAADVALVPLLDATANNAVLEALACGTPVISNRVGGMPDYINDECGWLFDRGEVGAIVGLIASWCDDRGLVSGRRLAARQKAEQFTWQRVATLMHAVYQAVSKHESPAGAVEAERLRGVRHTGVTG